MTVAVAEPTIAEAIDLSLAAQLEVAKTALKYYADLYTYENEQDGDAFIPGTALINSERGKRARAALKELKP